MVYEDPVPVLQSALEYLHTLSTHLEPHFSWQLVSALLGTYLLSTHIYTCRVSAGPAIYPLFVQTLLFAREHFYPEMVQQATTQCGTIFRQILCGNVMLPVVRDKQYQSLPLGWNL